MRTTHEIATRAATLNKGRTWRIKVHPKLTYGNADINPLCRTIRISPAYLDAGVDGLDLDATLLHEMGHFYDPAIRSLLIVFALLFVILMVRTGPVLTPALILSMLAIAAFRRVFAQWFEDRADAWASKRMPDYLLHKNRI